MGDPTAFDIDFDPTTKRMRGYAAHGNRYFDVPFVSQITDDLWQGGCEEGLILPAEVQHLVSLYPWERYRTRHELMSGLEVRLYDDTEQSMDMIVGIAEWVNVCRKTGVTLVHCQAGLNRSALVCATALTLEGMAAEDAISMLREARSPVVLCNPHFESWLLER